MQKSRFFPTYDGGLCLSNEYAEILQYKLLKYRIIHQKCLSLKDIAILEDLFRSGESAFCECVLESSVIRPLYRW
jgi:hypothetical protein